MEIQELETTAELAMLELDSSEMAAFQEEVSKMLGYFSHMAEIDTEGLEPTTHVYIKENRVREDRESRVASADECLDRAPKRSDRFIVIPKVL